MVKICFVILHYMSYDDTKECIESILNNISYNNYEIIVIDNNSTNDSANRIKELYKSNKKIEIIINNENVGFAKGNNIGYVYAKDKLNADYIIIMNNDTIINQKNFIELIIDSYKINNYHIMGPDILSADGIHQNPQRLSGMTLREVNNLIAHYNKQYLKYKIIDLLKIYNIGIKIKDKFKKNNTINNKENDNPYYKREVLQGVQLHGACIVFSPLFIRSMDYAFYPETFMYGEEDILHYICNKNKFKIVFDPKVKIYHKEDASTNLVLNNEIKKRLFTIKYGKESIKILKNIMEKDK